MKTDDRIDSGSGTAEENTDENSLPCLAVCKLLTLVCEAELENDIVHDLGVLGASGYTITDARGRGTRGVRDASWSSGANIRVEVLCNERRADVIVRHLENRYYANYAMVLFLSDVAVLRPEKFSK